MNTAHAHVILIALGVVLCFQQANAFACANNGTYINGTLVNGTLLDCCSDGSQPGDQFNDGVYASCLYLIIICNTFDDVLLLLSMLSVVVDM